MDTDTTARGAQEQTTRQILGQIIRDNLTGATGATALIIAAWVHVGPRWGLTPAGEAGQTLTHTVAWITLAWITIAGIAAAVWLRGTTPAVRWATCSEYVLLSAAAGLLLLHLTQLHPPTLLLVAAGGAGGAILFSALLMGSLYDDDEGDEL